MENDLTLRHPYGWITAVTRKWIFMVLLVLTIIAIVGEQVTGGPLKTAAAPGGIVSFELAGNSNQAFVILASWGTRGQTWAGLNLGLDYLFLVLYAVTIGLGCVLVAQNLAKRIPLLASIGVVLSWGLILAAIFDATENYALIHILLGSDPASFAPLAKWCAIFKFLIVGLGLIYFLFGGLGTLFIRNRKTDAVVG